MDSHNTDTFVMHRIKIYRSTNMFCLNLSFGPIPRSFFNTVINFSYTFLCPIDSFSQIKNLVINRDFLSVSSSWIYTRSNDFTFDTTVWKNKKELETFTQVFGLCPLVCSPIIIANNSSEIWLIEMFLWLSKKQRFCFEKFERHIIKLKSNVECSNFKL